MTKTPTLFRVSHDVPHDATIGAITARLSRHSGTFAPYFVANGPAGGNPFISFYFEAESDAAAYLQECYPDEEKGWLFDMHVVQVVGSISDLIAQDVVTAAKKSARL